MIRNKSVRERGKIPLGRYFQEFKEGDVVAVVKNISLKASFPDRIQGKTGVIDGKRGKDYIVKLRDFQQEKRYIIPAIHLKKIKGGR